MANECQANVYIIMLNYYIFILENYRIKFNNIYNYLIIFITSNIITIQNTDINLNAKQM